MRKEKINMIVSLNTVEYYVGNKWKKIPTHMHIEEYILIMMQDYT